MGLFTPSDRDATLARAIELLQADPRIEAAVITGSGSVAVRRTAGPTSTLPRWSGTPTRPRRSPPTGTRWRTGSGRWSTITRRRSAPRWCAATSWPTASWPIWRLSHGRVPRVGASHRGLRPRRIGHRPGRESAGPGRRPPTGAARPDSPSTMCCMPALQPTAAGVGNHSSTCSASGPVHFALASERHGWDADEFTRVDDLPPAEREPLLSTFVTDLERGSLLSAIGRATRSFLNELRHGDPELAARLEQPLLAFIAASREAGPSRDVRRPGATR